MINKEIWILQNTYSNVSGQTIYEELLLALEDLIINLIILKSVKPTAKVFGIET